MNYQFISNDGPKANKCKELEKLTGSNIYFRGNSIIIKGDQKSNEMVRNAIEFLTHCFKVNGTVEKKDIVSSLNKFMVNEQNGKDLHKVEYMIKTPKSTEDEIKSKKEIEDYYV